METLELLRRDEAGLVTLEGVPVRQWYEAAGVVPDRFRYRGKRADGRRTMCLLTTLAYARLGRDAAAMDQAMDQAVSGDPRPYKLPVRILAELLDLRIEEAAGLEAGWMGGGRVRFAADYPGLAAYWDLGRYAWLAVSPEPVHSRLFVFPARDLIGARMMSREEFQRPDMYPTDPRPAGLVDFRFDVERSAAWLTALSGRG